MSKLSGDVRLQIARKNTSEIWKIDDLLDAIKTEIEARESSEGAKTSVVDGRRNSSNSKSQTLVGGNALLSQTQGEFKIRCVFCDNVHYSASCDVVKSVERRILTTSGRCYNCFKKGHQAKNCSSERNCRHCKKRHHQSICDTLRLRETKREAKNEENAETQQPSKCRTTRQRLQLQRVMGWKANEIVFCCKPPEQWPSTKTGNIVFQFEFCWTQ